jgi:hypothetical protein
MNHQPPTPTPPTRLACIVAALLLCGPIRGQENDLERAPISPLAASVAHKVPLDQMPAAVRERVRRVMEQPKLSARGPIEVFRGRMDMYQWLLDHPDRGVTAWRRLGSKCSEITDRGHGRFGWTDGQGSDIHWDTVYRSPLLRVWYAEGKAKPGPLLPAVSVQAVAVIRCNQARDGRGCAVIYQQGDLYLHTDSKAAALAAELLGRSAPQLMEEAISQMQLFFSALIWYADRHPERAELMFGTGLPPLVGSTQ